MTRAGVDTSDDHGFELRKRPTWIWIAVSLVVVVVAIGKTQSVNEIAGATFIVAINETDEA